MLPRNLVSVLKNDLESSPAVVLYGPRQVGKTTLVMSLYKEDEDAFIYLDLESRADMAKMQDPELFLAHHQDKTVILDEVQTIPDLFPVLRSLIDKDRKPGRFILLGSASPELLQHSSESLAGRTRYREMFPLTLSEVRPENRDILWFRGGFPPAFLAKDDSSASQWLEDFIYTYAGRDLRLLGLPMQTSELLRLLRMLAHQHGQLLNYSSLSRSLGVSMPTVKNALYYLEEALLIRTLQPWHANLGKRLVKTPKVFIRDTGMLHHLLFLENYEQLMGHPQAGNSWEGFVIQQIISVLPKSIHPWFYRTQAGAEIDLVLSKGEQIQCAIEIKLTNAPTIKRGNTEAVNDLKPKHRLIITPSADTYPIRDYWKVYSLENFLNEINDSLE